MRPHLILLRIISLFIGFIHHDFVKVAFSLNTCLLFLFSANQYFLVVCRADLDSILFYLSVVYSLIRLSNFSPLFLFLDFCFFPHQKLIVY